MKNSISIKIDQTNWSEYCHQLGRHRVFVSIGGEPVNKLDEEPTINFIYYVILAELDGQQIKQSIHTNLNLALEYMNRFYGHWPVLPRSAEHDSKCLTCH